MHKWSPSWDGVSCIVTFDLALYLQGNSAMTAIKLLKYGTSCHVRSTACTVLDGCFLYLAQMIISMRGCVMSNDLWPWPLSSRAFSHNFIIKLLKYGTFCRFPFTACTFLNEFWPYLTQMITSMRGCVAYDDLWGDDVSCTISRSIGQSQGHTIH